MGKIIRVTGKVQGVGFRPFIYRLAILGRLKGFVRNESGGVYIEVEGNSFDTYEFINSIKAYAPALSDIKSVSVSDKEDIGYRDFRVESSLIGYGIVPLVSDIATCKDCVEDILSGIREGYAFTNCTNCGPRYSIIKKLPYDRETTTMNNFQMCHECKCEYENPLDRRFHAQPNCCSKCGPSLILLDKNMRKIECNEIKESIEIIKQGKIICLKGLTGYNLVCLPESQSINRLRINKNRRRKPLAIMMRDIETVKKYCRVSAVEENILTSESRPIVILEKKNSSYKELSSNSSLGVILPYTPLHYMLLSEGIESFVFTSGNLNNNPIIYEDKDLGEVSRMADYFLIHNRDINIGVDDSVVRVEDDIQVIRPGRGYYPLSTKADNIESGILSVGSLLKNTLSISSNGYIFTSPYIGDIESLSGEKRLQVVYKNLKDIYGITQKTLVYDAHPFMDKIPFIRDFHGEKIRVYHHHSHIVSCMGENNYFQNVIGIAFDGLGYGEDLGLWGGEFLICSLKDFKRVGNIGEFPLVGGDAATLSPWKIGISLIHSMIDNSEEIINRIFYEKDNIKTLRSVIDRGINSPKTSSIGRLFDGVASILGFHNDVDYEGEGAIYLEELGKRGNSKETYDYDICEEGRFVIDTSRVIQGIVSDFLNMVRLEDIALKFHNTIIRFSCDICIRIRRDTSLNTVALSGGVFQNSILLNGIKDKLLENGFKTLTHRIIPCNDSGLSVGQLYIANELMR